MMETHEHIYTEADQYRIAVSKSDELDLDESVFNADITHETVAQLLTTYDESAIVTSARSDVPAAKGYLVKVSDLAELIDVVETLGAELLDEINPIDPRKSHQAVELGFAF